MVNPLDLTGKNILFIGDTSSLDNAIIDRLKELGGRITDYNDQRISTIEHVLRYAVETSGPYDGVVYGIVHSVFKPLQFLNPELVGNIMQDNYGMFIEVMRVLKKTRGMANGASIVVLSSISSFKAMKAKLAFCSAKAALDSAVRCLAVELGGKGIRINSIQKGGVDVDLEKMHIQDVVSLNGNDIQQKQFLGLTKGVEVANTVAFLLSDAAPTITGTSIVIDGGYSL